MGLGTVLIPFFSFLHLNRLILKRCFSFLHLGRLILQSSFEPILTVLEAIGSGRCKCIWAVPRSDVSHQDDVYSPFIRMLCEIRKVCG